MSCLGWPTPATVERGGLLQAVKWSSLPQPLDKGQDNRHHYDQ